MNPLKTLYFKLKSKVNNSYTGGDSLKTWQPFRSSMFGHMSSDAYSSSYPSIRAISNEYMTVRPFAVDKNGNRVENNSVINALYHPNQTDSSVSFFEKLAVSTLALRKTYLLVWRREGKEAKPGGEITPDNIAGFTFLEFPSIERVDGKTYYNIGSQKFSEQEVIVLPGGVDPYNLYGGYSPSEASRRWAKLDDYIADYQAGFFENGAIPAGQFLITAASVKDYTDTVAMLEERHRGAGKNGNVTYAHRPIDPESGKPAAPQIEWIPFGQPNKDIDFKNLFEQTNKRIDVAFGVPQIVKGVDDAATYANAQVAEKTFAKRAVYPLLLRNYTQITHELNRITNGLGVSITFAYEIPTVADEELVDAQRKAVDVTVINAMTDKGYSLESIVEAFELPKSYEKLVMGTITAGDGEEDNTDVDEGGEVEESPDKEEIDGVKVVNKKKAKKPKAVKELPVVKAELTDKEKIEAAATDLMQSQVDRAVKEAKEEPDNQAEPTEDERQVFIDAMMVVIVARMIAEGSIKYGEGVELLKAAEIGTENLEEFVLSDTAGDSYRAYMAKVGDSYGSDTAKSIRAVLTTATDQGFSVSETEKALKNIMNTDKWRVTRLSETELARSESLSGVEAMKQIQTESGVELEKALMHTGGGDVPCPYCSALIGQWIKVDQPLLTLGESIVTEDGEIRVNDFVENEGYDPHPNGHCTMEYRVVT